MNNNIFLIILGMTAVTCLPRIIPFFMISGKELPRHLKLFLEFIPYSALGALIFPGVVSALPGKPAAVFAGLAFVCIYSWFRRDLIVPVTGAIAVVYVFLLV